ncbi:MAG: hypothetical protein ACE5ED_10710 [Rhodothalassiaceae bacterium]
MPDDDKDDRGTAIDRRMMLLAGGAVLVLAACGGDDKEKKGGGDAGGRPCPVDKAVLRDKFLGMLLLGAYGDALGGPHEFPDGLNGRTTDPGTLQRLPPFGRYRRDSASPWGLWPDPSSINKTRKGVITGDTSFRVAILHQWLCALARSNEVPGEAGFLAWLKARKAPLADAPQWQKSRYAQIRAWVCMLEDGKRLKTNREDFEPRDGKVDGKPVQTFSARMSRSYSGPFSISRSPPSMPAVHATGPTGNSGISVV